MYNSFLDGLEKDFSTSCTIIQFPKDNDMKRYKNLKAPFQDIGEIEIPIYGFDKDNFPVMAFGNIELLLRLAIFKAKYMEILQNILHKNNQKLQLTLEKGQNVLFNTIDPHSEEPIYNVFNRVLAHPADDLEFYFNHYEDDDDTLIKMFESFLHSSVSLCHTFTHYKSKDGYLSEIDLIDIDEDERFALFLECGNITGQYFDILLSDVEIIYSNFMEKVMSK